MSRPPTGGSMHQISRAPKAAPAGLWLKYAAVLAHMVVDICCAGRNAWLAAELPVGLLAASTPPRCPLCHRCRLLCRCDDDACMKRRAAP